jgi:hypothetical protein
MGSDFLQANTILILEFCDRPSGVVATILTNTILDVVGRKFNHHHL